MYEARQGLCRKDGGPFKIGGYVELTTCDSIANALQKQPIAVTVSSNNWEDYKGGIWKHCSIVHNH